MSNDESPEEMAVRAAVGPRGRVRAIDWVIAGCESGPGARPCDVAWLRSLRDQCAAAAVPFFLKQAVATSDGDRVMGEDGADETAVMTGPDSKRKAGGVIELPYLDGEQWAAFPTRW